jgi:broad specificity phosphatase PhoE
MSKKIILLRHAEEPEDGDSLDLSEAGRTRAEKLASYIPKTFGKPRFLFAAAPSDKSVRCYLTLRPLADRLRLNIEGTYEEREFRSAVGEAARRSRVRRHAHRRRLDAQAIAGARVIARRRARRFSRAVGRRGIRSALRARLQEAVAAESEKGEATVLSVARA